MRGLKKGLYGPLCRGPLHTQGEPSLGDGLSLDPNFSAELSANFLLFFGGNMEIFYAYFIAVAYSIILREGFGIDAFNPWNWVVSLSIVGVGILTAWITKTP